MARPAHSRKPFVTTVVAALAVFSLVAIGRLSAATGGLTQPQLAASYPAGDAPSAAATAASVRAELASVRVQVDEVRASLPGAATSAHWPFAASPQDAGTGGGPGFLTWSGAAPPPLELPGSGNGGLESSRREKEASRAVAGLARRGDKAAAFEASRGPPLGSYLDSYAAAAVAVVGASRAAEALVERAAKAAAPVVESRADKKAGGSFPPKVRAATKATTGKARAAGGSNARVSDKKCALGDVRRSMAQRGAAFELLDPKVRRA